jgi:hypothetical protein
MIIRFYKIKVCIWYARRVARGIRWQWANTDG